MVITVKRARRGVSTVLGGVIIIGIMLSMIFALLYVTTTAQSSIRRSFEATEKLQADKSREILAVTANYDSITNETNVEIRNNGTISTYVKYIIYSVNNTTRMLDVWAVAQNLVPTASIKVLEGTVVTVGDTGYIFLNPRNRVVVSLEGDIDVIAVATMYGVTPVVKEAGSTEVVYSQVAGAVLVQPIVFGSLENLGNRTDITVDEDELVEPTPDNLGSGMRSNKAYYVVAMRFTDARVYANQFHFGNAVIGFDPVLAKQGETGYNMLLTGPYGDDTYIYINGRRYNLDSLYPYGWRVKILGFVPDNANSLHLYYSGPGMDVGHLYGSDTIGFWYYSPATRGIAYSYLSLSGTAREVIVYKRVYGSREFSYAPYLISVDTDGNGNSEYVFMTEDVAPGHSNTLNDVFVWYSCSVANNFDDWSVKPFYLNLTGYTIDSTKVAMITIAFRIYFHDNFGDDIDEVEYSTRKILTFYLVDAETGKIYETRSYSYQTLAQWEDTYPPNQDYIMQSISMLIPNNGHLFYVGVAFADPYADYCNDPDASFGRDDGDITIGFEWLGITFFARPPT